MRSRVVIHAGFAKCGSACIRYALFQNFRKLQKHDISVFDKNLRIARKSADLVGTQIWTLAEAKKKSENLTQRLSDEITAVARRKTDHIAVLTAENLTNPGMAQLFAGLDSQFEVSVIFYIRPQLQWIPSAWKQWGLKKGVPLSDFVSQCIDAHRPSFRLGIQSWESALPAAGVHVRFLIPELLRDGNLTQDFFNVIKLPEDNYDLQNEPQNPSLDVSILHVLSKNPHLFSGVHDNSLGRALTRALPKKFRSANIQMLSPEQETRIEERFRDENLWLLNTYASRMDVDRIYRTYFTPREAVASYSNMSETDLIYRCLGIILESIAFTGDQVASGDTKIPSPNVPITSVPSDPVEARCRARARNRSPGLLFDCGMEIMRPVRWAWPFKARVAHDRDEQGNCLARGDPRPDFLCVGGQRSGTTWLYRQLNLHPDFWMPPIKELRYFDQLSRTKRAFPGRHRDQRDACFLESVNRLSSRPYLDMEGYARLFELKGSLLSGDITPAYSMLNDEIIERITSYFPSLKVIFLARDPVERVWSQLSLAVCCKMIRPFDVNDVGEVTRNLLHSGVLLRSHPSKIVARWRRYVHSDLFRLYFFDDLERSPTELRRSILDFLGADPNKPSGRLRADHNNSAGIEKLQLTDKVRSHVAQFFKDELRACATELGGPAREWPARYGFSLLWFFTGLADDVDLLLWCDWLV